MKDIRAALRAWLIADSAIVALIGSGDNSRIYPVRLKQGVVLTSIVYTRISEQSDYHMQGASGVARTRIQIDAWARSQDAAATLANVIKDRMDALRDTTITYGSNSPTDEMLVQGAFHDDGREDYDETADMHRMSRDYFVWYAER